MLASLVPRTDFNAPADNLIGPIPDLLAISLFAAPATTTVRPTRIKLSWPELVARLLKHERRPTKDGRGWSGATYKPGTTRANANVVAWSVAGADIEHVTLDDVQELCEHLEELGLAYAMYSTYGFQPEDPRIRLAIPLAKVAPAKQYPGIWRRIDAHIFKGKNDPQTKDASRMLYLPAAPEGAMTLVKVGEGLALDWEKLPAAPSLGAVKNGATKRGADVGIGRDTMEFILFGAENGAQRGRALAATRSLLAAGKSIEETAEKVWQGLQASPCGDPAKPWTYEHALKFAEDLANREPTALEERPGFKLDISDGGFAPPPQINGANSHTASSPKDTIIGAARLNGKVHTTYVDGRVVTRPVGENSTDGSAPSHRPASFGLRALLAALGGRGDVPEIDANNQDLRVITRQAWDAITSANREQPFIFKHGGVPVWISRDDEGRATLGELTQPHIRHILARVAESYVTKITKRVDEDGEEHQTKTRRVVLPPTHLCADVLATPDPDLPVVSRLTESPVFAPDGTLQTTPGYHSASRTYLAIPPGLTIPPVPDEPSMEDIGRARALIVDDLLGDFPFASPAEEANAIGLGIEPFARDMIDGPVPLHSVEAPTPGSGKGLLVDALLSPSCGRTVGAISQAKDEDEWRKRITSSLVQGYPAIQIDNANKAIESGALSMAITIPIWTDRILGQTRMVSVPVRCSWVVTANNPTYSTEMARRTVRTRIDPKVDRPQDREGFRHPELLGWIDDNRGELIWAFCTLVRAWVAAGKPKFSGKALGSFERWSHVVGGILEHAGIGGFLANQSTFYDVADAETTIWRSFVLAWWEKHQDKEVGTVDLFPLALDVDGLDLGNGQERSQKTRFGKLLGAQRDRVIAGYRVVPSRTMQRAQLWRLLPTEPVNVVNVSERFAPPPHIYVQVSEGGLGAETFTDVHNVHTPPSGEDVRAQPLLPVESGDGDDVPLCLRCRRKFSADGTPYCAPCAIAEGAGT